MSNYEKGTRSEYSVIEYLLGKGYAVIRAAGSGTAEYHTADIVAEKDGTAHWIEVKSDPDERGGYDVSDMSKIEEKVQHGNVWLVVDWGGNEYEVFNIPACYEFRRGCGMTLYSAFSQVAE